MNSEKFKPIFTLLLYALISFIIQKSLFYFLAPKGYEDAFVYSIALLYLFYFFFSSILILVLDKVKQNNMNSIGYVFLLLTTFKMGIAYLLARPILAGNLPKTPTEKISFFVIFIYFLTIETYVTIRILNNKQ
jgi:hypothetical protein